MSRLERTQVGVFHSSTAIQAIELNSESIQTALCPAVTIVQHLPQFDCSPEDVANLLCGRVLAIDQARLKAGNALVAGQQVALTRHNFSELLALAVITPELRLQPRTVFIQRETN